ncbi:MAG TPA: glycosyltransferase family 4 protein, partial [Candidatus Acidoferrum sp.]
MRLAVLSPFLDRRHGTERCIIEQLERISSRGGNAIHIYAQRVEDLQGVTPFPRSQDAQSSPGTFWHRVGAIPGPHLLQYIFWFYANRLARERDARRGLNCDLTYSPGINATDADAVTVHIVFHEFVRQVRDELRFRNNPPSSWPRLLHRRLYYRWIMRLENAVYNNPRIALAAVSSLVAQQLTNYFHRVDVRVIRNGVDAQALSPAKRLARRDSARRQFELRDDQFVLLFIANDWKKKGLDGLLRALAELQKLPWTLLIVGADSRAPYEQTLQTLGIASRVTFLAPSPDVLQFYAAADAYAAPALEDAYGLPVLEAMACGLPVVASSRAGVSEIVTHDVNGLVLRDPRDTGELVAALNSLITDAAFCRRLGEQAALTAQNETWDRNAQATWEWLNDARDQKNRLASPVQS